MNEILFTNDANKYVGGLTGTTSYIILLPNGTYTPNSDTIGYWKMNQNLLDNSGLNNSGTTTGAYYVYVNGVYDYCLYTTGTSTSYGKVLADPSLNFSTTGLTISLWAKYTGTNITGSTYRGLVSTDGAYPFNIIYCINTIRFYIRTTDGYINNYFTKPNNWNDWNHFVGVYDGSYIRVYVNGIDTGQQTAITGLTYATTKDIYFGNSLITTTEWEGYIDEVILEKKAWTANEVINYYNYSNYHIRGY